MDITSRRIKVIIVAPFLTVGGAERFSLSLPATAGNQVDFVIVSLFKRVKPSQSFTSYFVGEGMDKSTLPSNPFEWARLSVKLGVGVRFVIGKEVPDAILMSAVGPLIGVLTLFPSILKRVILRVTMNPFEVMKARLPVTDKLVYPLEALAAVVMSQIGHTIFPAYYLKERFHRAFRLPLSHSVVIRNSVEIDTVRALSASPVESWPSGPVIVTVGRLVPQKNLPLLLRAFARVRSRIGCKLVVIGDGPQKATLLRLACALGISDDVTFMGWSTNPYKYIRRSSVFVLTSNSEGMPNSLLEAMAIGVPIISTSTQGAIEILGREDPAGILVPMDSVGTLADAVEQMLRDEGRREEFAAKSRQRAYAFSSEALVPEYLRLFSTLKMK